MFAYSTSVHACTNYTPYYLTHGREARVPVDVLVPSQMVQTDLLSSHTDFVTSLAKRPGTAFSGARQWGTDAHDKQKLYYDRAVRHQPYTEGDLVWLHNPTEDSIKLVPHWKGPYRVLAVLGSQGEPGLTYRIADLLPSAGQEQIVHYDRLKPYTVGLIPVASASSVPTSPLHASSHQELGWPDGHCGPEDLLLSGGMETAHVMGIREPLQTVSRFGRTVRPVHFKDFVTCH